MEGKRLDKNFWDGRYRSEDTGWDLGEVSPPIKAYVDQLKDRDMKILIPGCGNAYEADYLLKNGFSDITIVDISPTLVNKLEMKFNGHPGIKVIQADFFQHAGMYDLIIEQTFFCAIDRELRQAYARRIFELLRPEGKLVGLLFEKEFEIEGPPFGGSKSEYGLIFSPFLEPVVMESCYNSFTKRANTELFVILKKLPYVTNVAVPDNLSN